MSTTDFNTSYQKLSKVLVLLGTPLDYQIDQSFQLEQTKSWTCAKNQRLTLKLYKLFQRREEGLRALIHLK